MIERISENDLGLPINRRLIQFRLAGRFAIVKGSLFTEYISEIIQWKQAPLLNFSRKKSCENDWR